MGVVTLTPNSNDGGVTETLVQQMNEYIDPKNEKINLESFDDCLDGLLMLRSKLARLFNDNLEQVRASIHQEEYEKIREKLNDQSERLNRKEATLKVDGAKTLKGIIKTVSAYDHLKTKPMGRDAFFEYCKQNGVPQEQAELIYISQCFNIEARRKMISENYALLAD